MFGNRYIMSRTNNATTGKAVIAILIVLALISTALVIGVAASQPKLSTKSAATGDLMFSGSAVMYPTVKALIDPFNQEYPGVTVSLNGTATASNQKDGITDFISGKANVAMASSTLTSQQMAAAQTAGKTPFLTVVAYDSICIIVNPSNPLSSLNISQIKAIFFDGTITDWSAITNGSKTGPIHVYALSAKTGTGSFFNKVVNAGAANNVNGSVMIDNAASSPRPWSTIPMA